VGDTSGPNCLEMSHQRLHAEVPWIQEPYFVVVLPY